MAYGEKYEETPKQKEQFRLWSAMYQIENIRKPTENNEYKQFIHMQLNPVYYELQRQLTNLNHSDNITEETKDKK